MHPVLVGLSHKTAPIEIRERVAFREEAVASALEALRRDYQLRESMILSTCNRVEVLAQGGDDAETIDGIKDFLYRYHSLEPDSLEQYLYALREQDAVVHVFRVASSLDSMVPGEAQILGQLKQAYAVSGQAGAAGTALKALLPSAFRVAKRVRTDTGISQSAVSVSSVAVELARKIFGSLKGKSVLLLGAGKMAELATRSLVRSGISRVFVASRTEARSRQLASLFGATSIPLADLEERLPESDILLVSTSSDSYILGPETVNDAVHRRKYAPLFIIDIAVPRNVDPRVNQIENVFLYDIDDLQTVIGANLRERRREAELAEEIVRRESERHMQRIASMSLGPLIADLRGRLEEICLAQLEQSRQGMTDADSNRMEQILRKTARRIAHPIIMEIKSPAQDPQRRLHNIQMIKQAFGLDKGE
ncbi:MAG: glutamyl-tRNA reductase [Acidobacteriota bacterium]|nr:glutamyl-tRNA reductase [Acidobacteriota bacterium]